MVPRSFGTHSGTFHADEVTACALLLLFDQIDKDKIVRTRDPEKLARCTYVCDVGGIYDPEHKRFDHHQPTYTGTLSSAGMIGVYLKERKILTPHAYKFLEESLLRGVDANDNGRITAEIGTCTFSHIVSAMMPCTYDAAEALVDSAFFSALDFAFGHIKRLYERFNYIEACREQVATAMVPREKYLLFSHSIPWMESFFDLGGIDHPALFVIMPAQGQWKLRGIPPSLQDRMQVRMPQPAEWGGLEGEALERVSGIKGAIFCHKGHFISIWDTREQAMCAMKKILDGNV